MSMQHHLWLIANICKNYTNTTIPIMFFGKSPMNQLLSQVWLKKVFFGIADLIAGAYFKPLYSLFKGNHNHIFFQVSNLSYNNWDFECQFLVLGKFLLHSLCAFLTLSFPLFYWFLSYFVFPSSENKTFSSYKNLLWWKVKGCTFDLIANCDLPAAIASF